MKLLNKLGVLAFALLLFFSTMLWYLANGSLNEYVKSQIELQGNYYSGLQTSLKKANYNSDTGQASLSQLSLANLSNFESEYSLVVDKAEIEISSEQSLHLLTKVKHLFLNKLIINIEQKSTGLNNIEQLIKKVSLTLANDYPQYYPEISARIYAQNNPELNADEYAKKISHKGPIIEHINPKKQRGKPQQKIIISSINIKNLQLNIINGEISKSIIKENIRLPAIGGQEGVFTNQLGGEILLSLFTLANEGADK